MKLHIPTAYRESQSSTVRIAEVKTPPRVTVVIPTLNEAKNLPFVLPRIPVWVAEVILVDGRSTDNTIEVAQQLMPSITVVREPRPGKGAALRAGFAAATGEMIVMLDADGSTDPHEIPNFVQPLIEGADFVKGSRFADHGGSADISHHRQLGNWALLALVRILYGTAFTDLCYGYMAFRRTILPALGLDSDGFEIETQINLRALQAQVKIVEVASFEAERIHGSSNLNALRDGWRVLKTILKERLRPTRLPALSTKGRIAKETSNAYES